MADILDDLKAVKRNNGHTYSSYEVLGMVNRAIEEIAELRAALAAAGRERSLSSYTDAEISSEHHHRMMRKLGDQSVAVTLPHPTPDGSVRK